MIETLFALVLIIAIAFVCHWVITTFFPEPIRLVALIIVGVIALYYLIMLFNGGVQLPW